MIVFNIFVRGTIFEGSILEVKYYSFDIFVYQFLYSLWALIFQNKYIFSSDNLKRCELYVDDSKCIITKVAKLLNIGLSEFRENLGCLRQL